MNVNAHVICFCCDAESRVWRPLFDKAGITLTSVTMAEMGDKQRLEDVRKTIVDLVTGSSRSVVLFNHFTMDMQVEEYFRTLPKETISVPIGGEAILLGCGTAESAHVEAINKYLHYSGDENVRSAGEYIRKHLLGDERILHVDPPVEKAFDGIYCFNSGTVYTSLVQYLAKSKDFATYVGIFFHRNNLVRDDLASTKKLAEQLEAKDVGVIPVFTGSNTDEPRFSEIVDTYFTLHGRLKIEALVNLQLWAIKAEEGRSVAEQYVFEFERMGIPIICPIQSHFITAQQWRELPVPISADMSGAYIAPEMAGMIEPIIISVRGENGKAEALPERIEYLANRIARLVRLRTKHNGEKKIVIMLHNSVCAGVEATIGKAFGLDAFESVVGILTRLEAEGYQTGEYPETGEALRELFMEKKAFSDFRWTAVEDIVNSGGCLYKMPVAGEYDRYYAELPDELQQYMEKTWGEPPGEGMALDESLIITGLNFGNITVMVQPKRGCYGAKCTGEVCKILHDPACPPPHQYLATYRYIEHILNADVCIDIGTHGSVENLPGKSNGLSGLCWPNIVMGSIPSFYIYNAGVTNESPLVKRRMNAVIIDHLPPPSMGADENTRQLVRKIEEYFTAKSMGNGQDKEAEIDICALLSIIPAAERIMSRADGFEQGLYEVSGAVKVAEEAMKISTPHVFGKIPNEEEVERFIMEVYRGDGLEYDTDSPDAQNIREGLMRTDNEMKMLIRGLSGGYIPAGEGGMPDENGKNILPTGRNMFGLNTDKVPTKTAYARGKLLAIQLLESYQKDEGRLPESVAMNMISLNITRTNGEQLSQFLYLLGVVPVWDGLERVTGLRV
ncbi:MAG: cobaltochelatase subunit CobN, partial [Oscillospiraceae bacterium]|nr:cobaltochelatase subunit CobN [Oscillospiraceae bacterium]